MTFRTPFVLVACVACNGQTSDAREISSNAGSPQQATPTPLPPPPAVPDAATATSACGTIQNGMLSSDGAERVLLDGCTVYWTTASRILRVAKSGGVPQIVKPDFTSVTDLTVTPDGSGRVYTADNGRLRQYHEQAGAYVVRELGGEHVIAVAASPEFVFFGVRGGADEGSAIYRITEANLEQTPVLVAALDIHVHAMLADESGVLYVRGDRSLLRIDGAGGAAPSTTILVADQSFALDARLARDGELLATTGEQTLYTVERRTGAVRAYAAGGPVWGVALSGARMYATRMLDLHPLALVSFALEDGAVAVLQDFGTLGPASLAADGDGVFVATSAGLASRP